MKIETIRAYIKIVEYLKNSSHTTKEIEIMLNNNGIKPSKRSIQYYLKENIDLFYGASLIIKRGEYYSINLIEYDKIEEIFTLSKQVFISSYLLKLKSNLHKHLVFDTFNGVGTKYIEDVIYAIDNKQSIIIEYVDFDNNEGLLESKAFEIEPYLLKSYLNRFYIIGSEGKNLKTRNFALSKIKNLQLSGKVFKMPDINKIKQKYSETVGLTHYDDNPVKPPKVVIEFSNYQFNYFRTEPWVEHYEIEERSENDETVKVSFYVHPNNELHQRILFNNVKCKVLEPQSLVDRIKEILIDTLKCYK